MSSITIEVSRKQHRSHVVISLNLPGHIQWHSQRIQRPFNPDICIVLSNVYDTYLLLSSETDVVNIQDLVQRLSTNLRVRG